MTAPMTTPELADSDHRDRLDHLICYCRPSVALCGWRIGGGNRDRKAYRRNPCRTCVKLLRGLVPCAFCGCTRQRLCRPCRAAGVR